MTDAPGPAVSIVIPTYNEEADIARCLDGAVSLDPPADEIIVVDDGSVDGTLGIVGGYAERFGIAVLRQPQNRGVAAARNRGLREATGEIVVILNADVMLPKDFLPAVLRHYAEGADFVLVQSRVANDDALFPRYIEAQHHAWYDHRDDIVWTEGFSCRRAAALAVGLFDEHFPGASGEDAVFGERLEQGYRKVIDRSIVVTHIAPTTLREFWRQRRGRGRGWPFRLYYVDRVPLEVIRYYLVGVCVWSVGQLLTVVPFVRTAARLARFDRRGRRAIPGFTLAAIVEHVAHRQGEVRAYREIMRRRSAGAATGTST